MCNAVQAEWRWKDLALNDVAAVKVIKIITIIQP
jgi:hypothetical protein